MSGQDAYHDFIQRKGEQDRAMGFKAREALGKLDAELPLTPLADEICLQAGIVHRYTMRLAGQSIAPRDEEEIASWINTLREAREYLNALKTKTE